MSIKDATDVLVELSTMRAEYDAQKDAQYCRLMQAYIDKAAQYMKWTNQYMETPFVDVTLRFMDELPEPLKTESEAWLRARRLEGAMANVCRWYIKYKLVEDSLEPEQRTQMGIYGPLIELMRMGGFFYSHHGAVGVGCSALVHYQQCKAMNGKR